MEVPSLFLRLDIENDEATQVSVFFRHSLTGGVSEYLIALFCLLYRVLMKL